MFSNPNAFIRSILNYDKNAIPAAVVRKITKVLMSPDFSMDKMKQANNCLHIVAKWTQIMMKFYELKNYGGQDISKQLDEPGSDIDPVP